MKKKTVRSTVAILALALFGITGCAAQKAAAPKAVEKASTEEHSAVSSTLSGKVTETMDAGGYTYVCLENGGKKTWAAIPRSQVAVGQELKVLGGAIMSPFTSKALNRTFDSIVFSGGVVPEGATTDAAGQKIEKKPAAQHANVLKGKVVETMSIGSYTYIFLEKDGVRAWNAVPTTKVEVGEELELIPGIDMVNFKSNILKRNFENIHFSAGVRGRTGKMAPQDIHPAQ